MVKNNFVRGRLKGMLVVVSFSTSDFHRTKRLQPKFWPPTRLVGAVGLI
jgi:hypothetical protein